MIEVSFLFASLALPQSVQVGATPGPAQGVHDVLIARDAYDDIVRLDGTGTYKAVFASHPFLEGPRGLTIGPAGDLYVAGAFSENVVRFDGRTGAFINQFVHPVGGRLEGPLDLTFGPDGNLYVSSVDSNRVYRYDGQTGAFRGRAATAPGPTGVAFGLEGYLYVSAQGPNDIRKFDSNGDLLGIIASAPELGSPWGIVIGRDGDLFASNGGINNDIIRYDTVTGDYLGVFAERGGLVNPNHCVFGPDGDLYVATSTGDEVLRYDGHSGEFVSSLGSFENPYGIVFMGSTSLIIDFETEDDFSTPLGNGQRISSGDEFGVLVEVDGLSASGLPAAVFDSSPSGPNAGSSDPDLLVDLGNVLILQENSAQAGPDFFANPDDERLGGVLSIRFLEPVMLHSVDLIDMCPAPSQAAFVELVDQFGCARRFFVPSGWTGDINVDGPPGYGTLNLTVLEEQVGFSATATAMEDEGFNPNVVELLNVSLLGSGAIDNIAFSAFLPAAGQKKDPTPQLHGR